MEAFADYARLCYRELGAHVKLWITLNEPNDEQGSHADGFEEGHQLLRAHALAWRAYDQEFRQTQGGQVGGSSGSGGVLVLSSVVLNPGPQGTPVLHVFDVSCIFSIERWGCVSGDRKSTRLNSSH